MKNLRRIRIYFERNKTDQKINFLWFLAGLATIPAIAGITGVLQKIPAEWLCALIIIESLLVAFLSVAYAILNDKMKVVNKHLKETGTTWEQIESDSEFGDAFEEATKIKEE